MRLKIGKQLSNVRPTTNDNAELSVKCTPGSFTLSPKAAEGFGLRSGDYFFLFEDAENNKLFGIKGWYKTDLDTEGNERGETLGSKLAGSSGSTLSFSGTRSWEEFKGDKDKNKYFAIAGLSEGFPSAPRDEDGNVPEGHYIAEPVEGFPEGVVARELIFVREEDKIQKDFSKKSDKNENTENDSEEVVVEEVADTDNSEEEVDYEM